MEGDDGGGYENVICALDNGTQQCSFCIAQNRATVPHTDGHCFSPDNNLSDIQMAWRLGFRGGKFRNIWKAVCKFGTVSERDLEDGFRRGGIAEPEGAARAARAFIKKWNGDQDIQPCSNESCYLTGQRSWDTSVNTADLRTPGKMCEANKAWLKCGQEHVKRNGCSQERADIFTLEREQEYEVDPQQ